MWNRPESRNAWLVASEMPPRSPVISALAMAPVSPGSAATTRRPIAWRTRAIAALDAQRQRRLAALGVDLGGAPGVADGAQALRTRPRGQSRSRPAAPAPAAGSASPCRRTASPGLSAAFSAAVRTRTRAGQACASCFSIAVTRMVRRWPLRRRAARPARRSHRRRRARPGAAAPARARPRCAAWRPPARASRQQRRRHQARQCRARPATGAAPAPPRPAAPRRAASGSAGSTK